MEYIFGTVSRNGRMEENLKIIGASHTDLRDFQQVIRKYPDSTVVDNFRVVEKYREAQDGSGRTYDWYIIDSHSRYVDRTGPVAEALAGAKAELENALCEQDSAVEERLAAIEDALCELDKS